VTIDSVAAVQTRIAQIQQLVTAGVAGAGAGAASTTSASSASGGQSAEFASLLADAIATGTATTDPLSSDSSSTGSGSSMITQLLSQLAGGTSNTSMGLGTSGVGSSSGLASALASLTGATARAGTGAGPSGVNAANPTTQQFVQTALAEQGKPYVYGATAQISDPNPRAFDCSELTKWAAARSGVTIPDGATAQYLYIRDHGDTMTVQQALHTPGALLFHFGHEPKDLGDIPADGHVAISLGDGVHTIEARGHAYGTNVFDNAGGRSFNFAGMIPGMT
jgi:NlpC/P60 family protein